MSILTFLSGISSIVFALGFIVTPTLWSRFDYTLLPISHTGTLPKVRWIFNTGCIGAGISQTLFVIGVWRDSSIDFLPIGVVVFFLGAVCIVIAGLVTLSRSSTVHSLCAGAYFIITPIGGLIVELSLSSNISNYRTFGHIFAIVVLVGVLYFSQIKKSMAFAALWGIAISTLWIAQFYIL